MEKVDETKLRIFKQLATCWKLMLDTDRAILFGVCVSVYDLNRNELNDSAVHFLGVTRSSFMASPTENPLNLFHMSRLIMSFSLDQVNMFDTYFSQLCPMSLYRENEVSATTTSSTTTFSNAPVSSGQLEEVVDSVESEKSEKTSKKKRSRLDTSPIRNKTQVDAGDGNTKAIKTKKTITSTPPSTKRKSSSADLSDLRETSSKFPRIQRPVFYSDGVQLLRDERGEGPPDNKEKLIRNPCAREVEIVYNSESAHRPLCV